MHGPRVDEFAVLIAQWGASQLHRSTVASHNPQDLRISGSLAVRSDIRRITNVGVLALRLSQPAFGGFKFGASRPPDPMSRVLIRDV